MKITEKWLKKNEACESAIIAFKKQKKTDSLEILKYLVKSKNIDEKFWIRWLVGELISETDLFKIIDIWKNNKELDFEQTYELIDGILGGEQHRQYLQSSFLKYKAQEKETKRFEKIVKPYTKWFKENGFTFIKQVETFGRYFKCDSDGFGVVIRWHYDDSSDCHYVKWQSWWGNDKENTKRSKVWPVPKRDVYLEAETESYKFTGYYQVDGFRNMMTYIKGNNDKTSKRSTIT